MSRKTPRAGMPQRMASGFTLLVIMVALGILAIVLTAVLRMHSQTLFVDRQAKFNTIAVLLAQEKLAQIEG
ncbi:MAG: type II secretion system protein, partial [Desulfobacterales bacterium]|nr:type II secretion system protein [Desulfobacterales bacterium]